MNNKIEIYEHDGVWECPKCGTIILKVETLGYKEIKYCPYCCTEVEDAKDELYR